MKKKCSICKTGKQLSWSSRCRACNIIYRRAVYKKWFRGIGKVSSAKVKRVPVLFDSQIAKLRSTDVHAKLDKHFKSKTFREYPEWKRGTK